MKSVNSSGMKAKELMIGDWATCKKWIELPFKITRINDSGKYYYGITEEGSRVGPFLLKELEPIPLTSEILKKNGWKKEFDKREYMTLYHLEDEKYWLMWCISDHILDVQRQNQTLLDKYNLCAERVVIACNYVHELQNSLRLCEIEKEIVL